MDVPLFVTRHQVLVKEPRHFHYDLEPGPGWRRTREVSIMYNSNKSSGLPVPKKNTIRKIVKEKETCSNIIQTVRDFKTLGSRMARGKGLRGELCGVRDIGISDGGTIKARIRSRFSQMFFEWVNINNSQTRILVDNCFEFVHHVPGAKNCGRMNRTYWTSYNSTHSILRCKRLKTHQQLFSTTGQIGASSPEFSLWGNMVHVAMAVGTLHRLTGETRMLLDGKWGQCIHLPDCWPGPGPCKQGPL